MSAPFDNINDGHADSVSSLTVPLIATNLATIVVCVVCFGPEPGSSAGLVKYGGVTLVDQRSNNGTNFFVYTYTGLNLGNGGSQDAVIDFGTGNTKSEIGMIVLSYLNVASIEFVTGGNAFGNNTDPKNTFTATLDTTYVNVVGNDNNSWTANSDTVRVNHGAAFVNWAAQDNVGTPAGSKTMEWTQVSGEWACQTVGLVPNASSPSPIPPLLGRHLEPITVHNPHGLVRMSRRRFVPRPKTCTRRYVVEPIVGSSLVCARRAIPKSVLRELTHTG